MLLLRDAPTPPRWLGSLRLPKRFGLGAIAWLLILSAVLFAWRRDHTAQSNRIAALRGELLSVGKRDAGWGVEQLVGPPDTLGAGDLVTAWASATPDNQPEWIELEYADAAQPVEIEVHETYNPGALVKASIFDALGREIVVWQGVDPTSPRNRRGESKIPVSTGWSTKRVRLYLDSPAVPGWNEIDAVGLRDASGRVQWAQNATASSAYGGRQSARGGRGLFQLAP